MSFMKKDSGYTRQVPLLRGDEEDSEEELFERSKLGRNKQNDSAMSKVKHELEGAISIMKTNLGKVIDRGERLEDLEAKSESFEMNAFQFKSTSTKLKNRMWWSNVKMKLIFGLVVCGIIVVIIVSIIMKNKKN